MLWKTLCIVGKNKIIKCKFYNMEEYNQKLSRTYVVPIIWINII